MSELTVNEILKQAKLVGQDQKNEILMDAVHKTCLNVSMEYDLTFPQICGCLDIIKSEYKKLYFKKRFPDEEL